MPQVDIPFPTSSNPGRAPGEGSGRLVNCLAYEDGGGARWRPSAGLLVFARLQVDEFRGMLNLGGTVLVVAGARAYRMDSEGVWTVLDGSIVGSGPVTVARNNRAPVADIVIVASGVAYVVIGDVVSSYPDADLPTVNDVVFFEGYFIFTGPGGRQYATGLNTTDIAPLSIATAEARQDGLLRGVVYGQSYFACGTDTIEVSQNAGTSPYPLARSAVIPIGLASPWAIAGYQDGWGGPLILVAQDNTVRRLDGYTPARVSNDDLERMIATDKRGLRANVYTSGGNSFFVLSARDWTWELNVTTGKWNERESYDQSRWRGDLTVKAFGKWIVADKDGGTLYSIEPDLRAEGDDPLVWGLDSGAVRQFPVRIQVPAAYFDFGLGQAAIGENPKVMVSWSHDGGARWANPIERSLGRQGEFTGRIAVHRIGLTSHAGVRYRLRVSHPVYSSFAGGRMQAEGRR